MTGFGAAECLEDGTSYLLEIRSVNHRFLKLSVRMPDQWQFAEAAVERILRQGLSRGSVTCALRVRSCDAAGSGLLNIAVLQAYVDQLARVQVPPSVQLNIDLGAMTGLPGVTDLAEFDDDARQKQQAIIERLTMRGLEDLSRMRRGEGAALRDAIVACCDQIRERLNEIAARAPFVVEEYHERLKARVGQLMQTGGFNLEADGLMREVAIYAERCDISEEVTRLRSHLDQFRDLCDRGEQAGRTLDFLAQELLREANTIASKSNDSLIARNIVEVKGLIDRIKEQVQNVE